MPGLAGQDKACLSGTVSRIPFLNEANHLVPVIVRVHILRDIRAVPRDLVQVSLELCKGVGEFVGVTKPLNLAP